jgi:hypothetical protein
VLLADDGPLMELRAALGAGLRKFQYCVPESFRPHLTLSYNRQDALPGWKRAFVELVQRA